MGVQSRYRILIRHFDSYDTFITCIRSSKQIGWYIDQFSFERGDCFDGNDEQVAFIECVYWRTQNHILFLISDFGYNFENISLLFDF